MIRAHRTIRRPALQTNIYALGLHSSARPGYSSLRWTKALDTVMALEQLIPDSHYGQEGLDAEENPLLKALPPATDYITYLTVLEYSLTADQLPILRGILQDATLTAKIGWDLVHLLLPFLPASRECLQDVARLGNPREVILKVTEHLDALRRDAEEETDEEEGYQSSEPSAQEDKTGKDAAKGDGTKDSSRVNAGKNDIAPTKQAQFIALVEMLSILHPRIKTTYPSRFLSTSLPATMRTYSIVAGEFAPTETVLGLVKALSGVGRPKLPPRKSSSIVTLMQNTQIAPDPESQENALGPDEPATQRRLLQAFLVGIVQEYGSALSAERDIPGLAWCSRLQEKLYPNKVIPHRETFSHMFAEEDELQGRDTIMGQIVALSRDLKFDQKELLSLITKPAITSVEENGSSDPPAEIPQYQVGSLYLFAAIAASSSLFDVPTNLPSFGIFPEYAGLLATFIGAGSYTGIGTEHPACVDMILLLGYYILNYGSPFSPPQDEGDFISALWRLSMLSADHPSPTLRYHAHTLTSTILQSHPSDTVRLAFIQDTLRACPYERIKASAVGWFKNELLAADKNAKGLGRSRGSISSKVFTTPSTISLLFPLLFPNPREKHSADIKYRDFFAHYTFYLAALNLSFLLLSSPTLFSSLDIRALIKEHDFQGEFLQPLADMEKEMVDPKIGVDLSDVVLLEGMIQIVEGALKDKGL